MPIQWRTDYAIRLLYECARTSPEGITTTRKLAKDGGVPYDFARQIANELVRQGLLISRRGAAGGIGLARPASEITLLDIFQAMDEPPTLSLCTQNPEICPRTDYCPVHQGVWGQLDGMIEQYLSGVTLQKAVEIGEPLLFKRA